MSIAYTTDISRLNEEEERADAEAHEGQAHSAADRFRKHAARSMDARVAEAALLAVEYRLTQMQFLAAEARRAEISAEERFALNERYRESLRRLDEFVDGEKDDLVARAVETVDGINDLTAEGLGLEPVIDTDSRAASAAVRLAAAIRAVSDVRTILRGGSPHR